MPTALIPTAQGDGRGGAPQQQREQPRALNLLVDAAVGLEAEAAAAAAAGGARGPRPRTPPSDMLLHKPVGGLGRFFLRPEDGWAARPRPFSRTNKASKAGMTKAAYAAVRSACELLCPGEGKELLDGVMNVHKYNKRRKTGNIIRFPPKPGQPLLLPPPPKPRARRPGDPLLPVDEDEDSSNDFNFNGDFNDAPNGFNHGAPKRRRVVGGTMPVGPQPQAPPPAHQPALLPGIRSLERAMGVGMGMGIGGLPLQHLQQQHQPPLPPPPAPASASALLLQNQLAYLASVRQQEAALLEAMAVRAVLSGTPTAAHPYAHMGSSGSSDDPYAVLGHAGGPLALPHLQQQQQQQQQHPIEQLLRQLAQQQQQQQQQQQNGAPRASSGKTGGAGVPSEGADSAAMRLGGLRDASVV